MGPLASCVNAKPDSFSKNPWMQQARRGVRSRGLQAGIQVLTPSCPVFVSECPRPCRRPARPWHWLAAVSILVAFCSIAFAQPASSVPAVLTGKVVSGSIPLPGVTVTAVNESTGQQVSAATNVNGMYALAIPAAGRYRVTADFAAFAPISVSVSVTPGESAPPSANFSLTLISRAGANARRTEPKFRSYSGAAESLDLLGSSADTLNSIAGLQPSSAQGAGLSSAASNSDFATESVAVSGEAGTTNPFAGLDLSQMRQDAALNRSLSSAGQQSYRGGRGGGYRGRGFGNFHHFKMNQPHGAFFWRGGNGAMDAIPFSIGGIPAERPSYAQNQFGLTFFGPPYIPRILTNDTKDLFFLHLSGQRSSSPSDQYGTVPTAAERAGDFSQASQPIAPTTIYDPETGQPFPGNVIPSNRISPAALALLSFVPLPTQANGTLNYRRLASAESNTTTVGVRYMRTIGGPGGSPFLAMLRQRLGRGGPGLRQSFNVGFNYSHASSDQLNLFPSLGGKMQMHQYSLRLGYMLGKGRLTNNFSAAWNRSRSQDFNFFTSTTDIADQIGIHGLPENPLLYGLPSITLPPFTALSQQQPAFTTNQTITLSESSSWVRGVHNIRFGGDFHRVHLDMLGATGNETGLFTFTGLFTRQPGGASGSAAGSSFADFLLGLPQQSALQAPHQTSYLRQNAWDAFLQDDWRASASLTFLFGLRYEYFSPYSEKDDRLSTLDTGNDFASVATVLSNGVGPFSGKYPRGLIYPQHFDFSPRIGFAARLMRNTVLRGGYGINYATGQYAKFVQNLAFQPPFADVQTNEATQDLKITLANGFPAPQTEGNFAINNRYLLPYIQLWNLNLQRTLPGDIVMNIGYSGSKGTHLDVISAPGRTDDGSLSGVLYNYENSVAFSNYNALVISARRRLHSGVALGAAYTYSHSIDNATSVGGVGASVAQNWQNLLAEESNSSFDIRHQVRGTFLYQFPFGPDSHWLTTGTMSRLASGWLVSSDFDFATGTALTPHYEANVADVARGSTGSLRPDRVSRLSLTSGGGSLKNWFNKAAFASPVGVYGNASRYSIPGPGTVSVDMSLSKTIRFAEGRSFELRATAANVFNTVQYSGVNATLGSASYGQVISAAPMRQFTLNARFRY